MGLVKHNPGHLDSLRDPYCPGVDLLEQFEEDYPQSARGELEPHRTEKLYHGHNVAWIGEAGYMLRVGPDYLEHIWGNIFDECKLAGLVEGIREAQDKVVLYPGYSQVSVIRLIDVKEGIEAHESGDDEGLDRPPTTGDEELDRYLVEPEEVLAEYEAWDDDEDYDPKAVKDELDARLQEALEDGDGDLGQLSVTVRNGNHRAFGALLAGEPYIWIRVDADQVDDMRRNPKARDNQRILDALE